MIILEGQPVNGTIYMEDKIFISAKDLGKLLSTGTVEVKGEYGETLVILGLSDME